MHGNLSDFAVRSYEDYTVGWICALPQELAAATALLDDKHPQLQQPLGDQNNYTLGNIEGHNVVITCLPSGICGTTAAATVAERMKRSFSRIRFGLLVGIGGGVPNGFADIRLGDVVVSNPTGRYGGVIQYDFGKTIEGGRFQRTGVLNKPPTILLSAVSQLQARHILGRNQMRAILDEMEQKFPDMVNYPGPDQDLLFDSEYDHVIPGDTCRACDKSHLVRRGQYPEDNPRIFYGLIASGNGMMNHGATRDKFSRELDVLCFEMEAAGLMDHFPCLVIRGISDYADSHNLEQWKTYAAATAAAYTKELLSVIPKDRMSSRPSSMNTSKVLPFRPPKFTNF